MIEYRQKEASHTAPFTIEAEYLSSIEIEELIKELLWSFRQVFLPLFQAEETSKDEHERIEHESEQAWSALEAAFAHQDGFNKAFLSNTAEGALDSITKKLLKWTEDIEWPDDEDTGFWTDTAETAEDCSEKTSIFMEDKLWPFTKIIRYVSVLFVLIYADTYTFKGVSRCGSPKYGRSSCRLARYEIPSWHLENTLTLD